MNRQSYQDVFSGAFQRRLQGIHLVGSIPLGNTAEVLFTVSSLLGKHLRRIPDGETGPRSNWVGWQVQIFANHPCFEEASPASYRLCTGAAKKGLAFGTLGYAQAAIASYADFSRLKSSGVLPQSYRFQISLPTPIAVTTAFIALPDQARVEEAYEAAIQRELALIMAHIPPDELAIQWDVAVEFAILEKVMVSFLQGPTELIDRLVHLGRSIPTGVEMGYHLCYGDAEHKHFKEPEDMSKLVAIANTLSTLVQRKVSWFHMPVPRNRIDDAYFAPLRNLQLQPTTELYLGLVHLSDGIEGAQRRIAVAQKVKETFGIATECGWGRRDSHTIPALLKIHRDLVQTEDSVGEWVGREM